FSTPDSVTRGAFLASYSPKLNLRFETAATGSGDVDFISLHVSPDGRSTVGAQFKGLGAIYTPSGNKAYNLPQKPSTGGLLTCDSQGNRKLTKFFHGTGNVGVLDAIDDTANFRLYLGIAWSGSFDANPNDGVSTVSAPALTTASSIVSLTE